ncbi:MAG: hypothetical protein H7343_12905 [Undibacterium sp.]|nr:hypothetical protein [Opitutaceae bacterium]
MAGIASALAYYAYNAKVEDPIHLYLGLTMIVLSVLPGLMWARQAKFGLPLFEAFMVTGINTYAIPLLSGHQALRNFSPETITLAAFGVVLFQAVANISYVSASTRPKRTRFWQEEIVTKDISRFLGYGMIATTAYTVVVNFTDLIPYDLAGILRAVAYGIGIIATFIQSWRWGANELASHEKVSFSILLVLQVIFSWATLFLVGGISILTLGLLGYVSGGKKVPVLVLVTVLPLIGLLHNGKGTMRQKYWEDREALPSFTALPAFFSEWIGYGLDSEIQSKRNDSNRLLERTSLFHIMCLVVAVTPDRQPFLNGETYTQIPGQFVPRFFWPEKPAGHISTYTLAIYYGLQRAEDTAKTTIGFGLLTEAYANYGFFGLALIGVFFGVSFKFISVWASGSPILSYGGMFMVVLMAWSFQTELTMSIWLSSLFQACVAVLGIPYFLRNFIK